MSEIAKTFKKLGAQGSGPLIGYVTGGAPAPKYTPMIAEALINGGVDIVELGIPFSDPIADGQAIQAASARALEAGTTPRTGLETVKENKKKNKVPVVTLTYY